MLIHEDINLATTIVILKFPAALGNVWYTWYVNLCPGISYILIVQHLDFTQKKIHPCMKVSDQEVEAESETESEDEPYNRG